MKQRYNITVADMQLNIISDASQDEVKNIVGILDRRMRDINLKSPRCTKNEAAILCALSYCSERLAAQEAYKKAEKDAFRFAAENEHLKKAVEDLRAELETVRQDNAAMRLVLEHAAEKPQQLSFEGREFDTAPVETPAPEESSVRAESEATAARETEEKSMKAANKRRVGTMFDLLTFSDI